MSGAHLYVPPPLAAGEHIALVAPSGPFARDAFERGVRALEGRGYVCVYSEGIFAREGYLAGDDSRRANELLGALRDPRVRLIVAARGGFGATRLLPHVDVAEVRAAKKSIVGFSDITALHALWARAGVASLHAPMIAKLGDLDASLQARWFAALEGMPPPPLEGLATLSPGRVTGPLLGGNLAVLSSLVGTPYEPPLDGAVLLLEDIGERPYRLDRMLTTLTQAGWFERVRGLVFGAFTEAAPGSDGVTAREVLEQHAQRLGLPAVADAPFGHVHDNRELPLGRHVELDATRGTLRWP